MKKYVLLVIWMCILTLFTACEKEPVYPAALTEADSAMFKGEYAKAKSRLDRFASDTVSASQSVKMYYSLLKVIFDDKSYIPLKDLSLMERMRDYYKRKGWKDKYAKACFYTGCTYRDLNDAPTALEYYQKAEKVASEIADNSLTALIYGQMGELYFMQGLDSEAISAYQKYYHYMVLAKDFWRMSSACTNLARAYELKKDTARMFYYARKALDLAYQIKDTTRINSARLELAGYYLTKGRVAECKTLMGADPIYDSLKGLYYKKIGQTDSILFFCQRVLNLKQDIYKMSNSALILSELYAQRGNMPSAYRYLKLYTTYNDSVQAIMDQKGLKQVQSLYNYAQIAQERIRLRNQSWKERIYLGGMVLVALFLCLYLLYYKKKKDLRFAKEHLWRIAEQQKNATSEEKLERTLEKLRRVKAQLQDNKEKNEFAIRQLKIEVSSLTLDVNHIKEVRENNLQLESLFKTSSIYGKIKRLEDNVDFRLSKEDIEELCREEDKAYNNFSLRLKELVPLKDIELYICLLLKMGIKPANIANMLSRSLSAVSMSRIRLYKKLTGKKGTAKDLDAFIRSF